MDTWQPALEHAVAIGSDVDGLRLKGAEVIGNIAGELGSMQAGEKFEARAFPLV
jgi:hypothetical protein